MKVLVIGSGAREHALCVRLAASPLCGKLWCAPGSDAIAAVAEGLPELTIDRLAEIAAWAAHEKIDLAVIGPDAPVVAGLGDMLRAMGVTTFAPGREAARLEGSKSFMKQMCVKANVPTARFEIFERHGNSAAELLHYIEKELGWPAVIKADGLAAGKGVWIVENEAEARAALHHFWEVQAFGKSGDVLVVEEYLPGWEVSFFALCDGRTVLPFGCAQDHKRIGEGDTGPMTGGMGAFTPVAEATPELQTYLLEKLAKPLVAAMTTASTPFAGMLFCGVMVTAEGPKLLEINARFGDPETQALLTLLADDYDLLATLRECAEGKLDAAPAPRWKPGAAVSVVVAAQGYPGDFARGEVIEGLDAVAKIVPVYHYATKKIDGSWQADGGRVLTVVGHGADLNAARTQAYGALAQLDWPGAYWRRDIGARGG